MTNRTSIFAEYATKDFGIADQSDALIAKIYTNILDFN